MMLFRIPKDTERISWTRHVKKKMRQYGLSEQRVLRVLRNPERKEGGVALRTIAVMQIIGSKKHPTEIWMMYQTIKEINNKQELKNQKIRIISAWRYPGRSPIGKFPPIPEDILQELKK